MAGRFPGARNIAEFWRNLREGVESIRDRTDAELLAAGATSEDLASPDYVKRASVLDDVPMFDASFFGFSPSDASIMDPQHRHFLECAWEALEDAGHPPQRSDRRGSIGVFAGSGMNTYLIHNLLANRELVASAGLFQLKQTGQRQGRAGHARLATNLICAAPASTCRPHVRRRSSPCTWPARACSTTNATWRWPAESPSRFLTALGYIYREGEILSRDGHCRSFDASSSGTVFGSGLGIVVLRRLEDALADRDHDPRCDPRLGDQ